MQMQSKMQENHDTWNSPAGSGVSPLWVAFAVPMGSRLLGDASQPLPATSHVRVLHGEAAAISCAAAGAATRSRVHVAGFNPAWPAARGGLLKCQCS
jgi:hypothetical protein